MRAIKYLAPLFFLLLVYAAGIKVPMHSDDYSYLMIGTDFNTHLHHYLTWSGRVVADYVSGFLLGHLNFYIYTFLNSLALVVLIYCISIAPSIIDKTYKFSCFRFGSIAMLYWIANPNLGQTTFWIVGSANYLWTNMFIAIFIVVYLNILNKDRTTKYDYTLVVISGVIAGCSNENTSIVVLLVSIFSIIFSKKKAFSSVASISILSGALILLLSPGNFVRNSSHGFDYWRNMGIIDKIWINFFERLPLAMSSYWQVYFVIILCLIVVAFKGVKQRELMTYALVFFIASLMANAAFVASPSMPPRALNGSLFFLLMSTSIALSAAHSYVEKYDNYSSVVTISFLSFYFLPSYALFYYAVNGTTYQEKIRNDIIKDAQNDINKDAILPQWYFTKLSKANDKFDTFHSSSLAKFYGIKHSSVYNVNFDYGQIIRAPRYTLNLHLVNDAEIIAIYPYRDLSDRRGHLLFEFNKESLTSLRGNTSLIVHLYKDDDKFTNADVKLNLTKIGDRVFLDTSFNRLDYRDIKKATIGLYDNEKRENITISDVQLKF